MKILAIRGRNITSLAGPFELCLDEGPLASAGLFSITGPTGSGKSSLLDAMCLALFNYAPRLGGQSRVHVGRDEGVDEERLTTSDPRSLVRRDASSAFAEVDYQGLEGRRYRARWEVRRARDKVKGRLQSQTITLTDLGTGQILGGKQGETLKEIERTLGLTYDQFSRSALLAQGAFAAFLLATGGERAQLLEQMTGTEIYTALSKGAHDRATRVERELTQLEGAIDAVPMLDAEARAALEASLPALRSAQAEAQRAVQASEAAVRWFDERTRLGASVANAESLVKDALDARERSAALRQELALAERAQPLRPLVAAEQAAMQDRDGAKDALGEVDVQAGDLERVAASAADALKACGAAREQATTRLEDAGPELARAASLDAMLREKEQQLGRARAEAQAAAEARDKAQAITVELEAQEAKQRPLASDAEAWLDRHDRLRPLEAQWERWQAELTRYADAAMAEEAARQEELALAHAADEARAALDDSALRLGAANAHVAEAKEAWKRADDEAQIGAFSAADREARDALLVRKQAIEKLGGLAAEASKLRASQAEERAAHENAASEIDRARAVDPAAREAVTIVRGELQEAKRALEQLRATLGFEDHRARLEDGAPCPLCGSEEHPYARGGAPAVALFTAQEARVEDRERELQALATAEAQRHATMLGLEKEAVSAATRLTRTTQRLDELDAAWGELATAARVDAGDAGDAATATLAALVAEHEAELTRLREAEARGVRLAQRARELHEAWQRAQASIEQLTRALESAEQRANEAAVAVTKRRDELRRAEQERAKARSALEPAFLGDDGWQARLALDPRAFTAARADDVAAYRGARDRLASAEGVLGELRGQLANASSVLRERTDAAAAQAARLAEQEASVAVDRAERRKLLGGRGTSELEAELKKNVRERTTELEQAQKTEQAACAVASRAREARSAAQARSEAAAEALIRAEGQLRARLEAVGFTRAALTDALARDEAWIVNAKAELGRIDQGLADANTVLGERQRARALHEATARPSIEPDMAALQLGQAREDEQVATAELADANARLKQDDEAKAQRAERAAAVEQARKQAARWLALGKLIGSSDGKKFRLYAQSLTLDGLLLYANHHLKELTSRSSSEHAKARYRLMRVPGHEMELQIIDSDMADEVRGTNSLSGGETFLVSLALALALSSLAARDVRIGTLFIDEGFGSLDPDTLDLALSTLDELRSGDRQIGVISHVSALADKIGTQVRIDRLGAGRSRVVVEA